MRKARVLWRYGLRQSTVPDRWEIVRERWIRDLVTGDWNKDNTFMSATHPWYYDHSDMRFRTFNREEADRVLADLERGEEARHG